MTGAGQPDIIASDAATVNGPGTNFGWITDFSFETDGLYDNINYSYTNADVDGSRARFAGVIVTVPEPSGVALLGLAGLGFILRRRR